MVEKVEAYKCPFCSMTSIYKASVTRHIKKCHKNPDNKACYTCKHYSPANTEEPPYCFLYDKQLGFDYEGWGYKCEGWEPDEKTLNIGSIKSVKVS